MKRYIRQLRRLGVSAKAIAIIKKIKHHMNKRIYECGLALRKLEASKSGKDFARKIQRFINSAVVNVAARIKIEIDNRITHCRATFSKLKREQRKLKRKILLLKKKNYELETSKYRKIIKLLRERVAVLQKRSRVLEKVYNDANTSDYAKERIVSVQQKIATKIAKLRLRIVEIRRELYTTQVVFLKQLGASRATLAKIRALQNKLQVVLQGCRETLAKLLANSRVLKFKARSISAEIKAVKIETRRLKSDFGRWNDKKVSFKH